MKTRLLGAALALLCITAQAGDGAVPDALEPLHVDGPRIVDSSGREVIMRGVCAGMRSKMPPFYPFDPEPDFETALDTYADAIDSLGSNVVRLLVIYEAAEPVRGQYNERYLKIFDRMVRAFGERGIRVIIDAHQDVYSRKFCGDGFPEWAVDPRFRHMEEDTDCLLWEAHYFSDPVASSFDRFWSNTDGIQDSYVAFFGMLAERYQDEPAVVGFEPMNEPFPGWWGLTHYWKWYEKQLFPMYERVARAVHAVDRRYLILADICSLENTGSWSTKRVKPDIHNLVFAPHYYDLGYLGLSFSPGGDVETMRKGLTKHFAWAEAWNSPVFVSEYGVSMLRDDAGQYLTRLYSIFDDLHLHGTIWEASMSEQLWNRRRKLFLNPDGSVMEPAWNIDRPYPRAVSGVLDEFSFDAESGTFRLSWDESADVDAASLVYLPKRIYGEGYVVSMTPETDHSFDRAESNLVIKSGAGGKRELSVGPR